MTICGVVPDFSQSICMEFRAYLSNATLYHQFIVINEESVCQQKKIYICDTYNYEGFRVKNFYRDFNRFVQARTV